MKRNLHIIGPFNSGTNLLFNIINKAECNDLLNNTCLTIKDQHSPFGKHILQIKTIENYLNDPNNLLIIMYKNVYNWLYSIKKAHYDIKYNKLYYPVELYNKKFHNMIELYNFYYINYMVLLQRYPNAIFLDYNKVIDQHNSFDYINQKLSKIHVYINSYDKFHKALMKPAKNHGNSVKNTIEAKKKYDTVQETVINFIKNKPRFGNSIKPNLFDYYEN